MLQLVRVFTHCNACCRSLSSESQPGRCLPLTQPRRRLGTRGKFSRPALSFPHSLPLQHLVALPASRTLLHATHSTLVQHHERAKRTASFATGLSPTTSFQPTRAPCPPSSGPESSHRAHPLGHRSAPNVSHRNCLGARGGGLRPWSVGNVSLTWASCRLRRARSTWPSRWRAVGLPRIMPKTTSHDITSSQHLAATLATSRVTACRTPTAVTISPRPHSPTRPLSSLDEQITSSTVQTSTVHSVRSLARSSEATA